MAAGLRPRLYRESVEIVFPKGLLIGLAVLLFQAGGLTLPAQAESLANLGGVASAGILA